MAGNATIDRLAAPEVFQALADPIRWEIIERMAAVDELACVTLEAVLPVTKSTISYHMKILYRAELVDIRKEGRNYYYTLRRGRIGRLISTLGLVLASAPD